MKKESAFDRIKARSPLSNKVFAAKALDIADQLAAILTERGMSQRELARLLGKGDSEVSKWLSGQHNPTLETIAKLEAVLGVDVIITRLNPDGYFNRKPLRKLTVAASGGTHMLPNGEAVARAFAHRPAGSAGEMKATSGYLRQATPDTCLETARTAVSASKHPYVLSA